MWQSKTHSLVMGTQITELIEQAHMQSWASCLSQLMGITNVNSKRHTKCFLLRLPSIHVWTPGIHAQSQVRLLGDMHRGPTCMFTTSLEYAVCRSPAISLVIICKPSTSFYGPSCPCSITITPESCISCISIILSAAKPLLIGNLRQTYYGLGKKGWVVELV